MVHTIRKTDYNDMRLQVLSDILDVIDEDESQEIMERAVYSDIHDIAYTLLASISEILPSYDVDEEITLSLKKTLFEILHTDIKDMPDEQKMMDDFIDVIEKISNILSTDDFSELHDMIVSVYGESSYILDKILNDDEFTGNIREDESDEGILSRIRKRIESITGLFKSPIASAITKKLEDKDADERIIYGIGIVALGTASLALQIGGLTNPATFIPSALTITTTISHLIVPGLKAIKSGIDERRE